MRFEFGDFAFDGEARELTRNGARVRIAPKAFDLLAILIEERPRALRKQELQDRLWPDVVVEEANLKNLVGEIRAALGGGPWIRTVHRYGYAFGGEVNATNGRTTARLIGAASVLRLKPGANIVGRGEDCTVILDVVGVSRRHARITVLESRSTLEDLGSKNGTSRNGVRIQAPVELREGDRVRIGPLTFVFRSAPQPVPESISDADR